MREFHLGDILSVSTGKLLSPTHMSGIYDLLGYLTGEPLMTHQLPRAAEACAPWLLEQLPWLAEIDALEVNAENWCSRLKAYCGEWGAWHGLEPLPPGRYAPCDPLEEAVDRVGAENVVVIVKGGQQ